MKSDSAIEDPSCLSPEEARDYSWMAAADLTPNGLEGEIEMYETIEIILLEISAD